MVLMLQFGKKSFFSTIFIGIKVHLLHGTNLNSHNKLHSFLDRHYKHIYIFWIHGFDVLVLKKKKSYPFHHFYKIKVHHQMGLPWILIIISILLVIGHYEHIFPIGLHGFDALVWQKKPFFSIIFLKIKVCPLNAANFGSHNNFHSFSD